MTCAPLPWWNNEHSKTLNAAELSRFANLECGRRYQFAWISYIFFLSSLTPPLHWLPRQSTFSECVTICNATIFLALFIGVEVFRCRRCRWRFSLLACSCTAHCIFVFVGAWAEATFSRTFPPNAFMHSQHTPDMCECTSLTKAPGATVSSKHSIKSVPSAEENVLLKHSCQVPWQDGEKNLSRLSAHTHLLCVLYVRMRLWVCVIVNV